MKLFHLYFQIMRCGGNEMAREIGLASVLMERGKDRCDWRVDEGNFVNYQVFILARL